MRKGKEERKRRGKEKGKEKRTRLIFSIPKLDFLAYDSSFTGGVRVAAADITGDGHADIITGQGPGGGTVRTFNGLGLTPMASLTPYGTDFQNAGGQGDSLRNLLLHHAFYRYCPAGILAGAAAKNCLDNCCWTVYCSSHGVFLLP